MRILYVTNRKINIDLDLVYLSHFADPVDIHLVYSTENAETYITENQILKQAHLDFIIVDFMDIDEEKRDKLAIWLRINPFTYSKENFRICSIPLILIKEWDMVENERRNQLYSKIVYKDSSDEVKIKIIGTSLTQWMQEIGNDLDKLNLDLKLHYDKNKINWLLAHRAYKLNVLTETFIKKQQKMEYIWFGDNLKTFDISVNKIDELLRKSERIPSLRNEKEIHQYLLNNQRLLLGEFHQRSYYEQHFYLPNSQSYVEPDFTNIPYKFYDPSPEVFEIKLPNQKLVKKSKTIFYRNTTKAINQVTLKYRNFFADPNNSSETMRNINYKGNTFNYTLLIGRKRDREENLEFILNETKRKNFNLITYDELIEKFERLFDRTVKYNLS